MSNFEKVIEFNKSFGLPHYDIEQHDIFNANEKLLKLRISLCDEEIKELNEAFEQKDFIEVIDALTDELYVIYGAASSLGISLDNNFLNFMNQTNRNAEETNFDLVKNDLINSGIENSELLVKKSIWKNIFDIYDNPSADLKYIISLIKNLKVTINVVLNNLLQSSINKDFLAIKEHLCNLLKSIYFMGILLGIDLNKSFDIVHKSNMSKLCTNVKEAQETVQWYKDSDNRYDSPSYRNSDNADYWVVYNESTGKILKSINYTPANFSEMLN